MLYLSIALVVACLCFTVLIWNNKAITVSIVHTKNTHAETKEILESEKQTPVGLNNPEHTSAEKDMVDFVTEVQTLFTGGER